MYTPQEDSELMARFLVIMIKKEKPKNFLDMGCGSGIQSKVALDSGILRENILAVDIDDSALCETEKLGVKVSKSDLFRKVNGRFDLIAFNPPYLPADKYDNGRDTTGGKRGWETIARFLKGAKSHLTANGKILLLSSSLTNKEKVKGLVGDNGFSFMELATERLFMEKIYLWALKRKRFKPGLLLC